MHQAVMDWFETIKRDRPDLFDASKKVLECGSYNVNGSVRGMFNGEYIGVDSRPGPGVDLVATTWTLHNEHFVPGTFDVVVSTEMLEHDPHWQYSLFQMWALLKDDGALILTCAGPAREPHELDCSPCPGYYGGIGREELLRILSRHFNNVTMGGDDGGFDVYVFAEGKK